MLTLTGYLLLACVTVSLTQTPPALTFSNIVSITALFLVNIYKANGQWILYKFSNNHHHTINQDTKQNSQ